MSDFVVVPSQPAGQYSVTLRHLNMFAEAASELEYLNELVPRSDDDRLCTRVRAEELRDAIKRIAGPDASVIYAPDDGATAEPP